MLRRFSIHLTDAENRIKIEFTSINVKDRVMTDVKAQAWDRRASESDEEYEMFQSFRELRTQRRVADRHYPGRYYSEVKSFIGTIARLNQWSKRVHAYDRHMVDAQNEAVKAAFDEMKRVNMARAIDVLDDMFERIEQTQQRIDDAIAFDEINNTDRKRPKLYLTTQRTLLLMEKTVLETLADFEKANASENAQEQPFGELLEGANDKLAAMVKRAGKTLREESKKTPEMLQ